MTSEQRHHCMSMIRSRDTGPELLVRRFLFRNGFRYRLNDKSLPGTPDIVLKRWNTVVFINGCFWHGHRNCRLFVMPRTNAGFWENKIETNRRRDAAVAARLEARGWKVETVWECELAPDRVDSTLALLAGKIRANGELHEKEVRERRNRRAEYLEGRRRKLSEMSGVLEKFRIPASVRKLSGDDGNE